MQISPHGCLLAKSWQCQVHSLRPDFTCSNGHYFRRRWSIQHMDEAELAAGRVQVGEASILWHNEVDIEVDIEASEGPAVAAWSLLEASRPPVDLSGLTPRSRPAGRPGSHCGQVNIGNSETGISPLDSSRKGGSEVPVPGFIAPITDPAIWRFLRRARCLNRNQTCSPLNSCSGVPRPR